MKQIDDEHQSQLDATVDATLKSVNKPWKLKLRGYFTDYDLIMMNCGVQRNTCNDVAEAAKMAIAHNPKAEMEISINDLSTIRGI